MAPMADTAARFFEACEAGKGWEECSRYCTDDATFSAQAEPWPTSRTCRATPNG